MRGKELNTLIEHELQLMLVEGFDKSPISAKALHIRLKAKGIVKRWFKYAEQPRA